MLSDILEGGRLIISPFYQGKGFGALLLQAGTVLGKKLNRRLIWGVVGTKDGQVNTFLNAGYKVETDFEYASQVYDDHLALVTINPTSQFEEGRLADYFGSAKYHFDKPSNCDWTPSSALFGSWYEPRRRTL